MGLSPTCHGVHACALYQSVGMLVIACFLRRFCRQLETGCRQPETSLPPRGSCVLSHPRTRSALETLFIGRGVSSPFSGSSQERWWGLRRVSSPFLSGAAHSPWHGGACATVSLARLSRPLLAPRRSS